MNSIYQNIITSISKSEKLLAVLIDPDKMRLEAVSKFISKINQSKATHIFVGGSEVNEGVTETLVEDIKKHTNLPVILFPGDVIQITDKADAILFLSLISGRNPDYLIGKHVDAISKLRETNLEVVSTGYLLIENGKETSVERVSKTKPLKRNNIKKIIDTAKAGELLGKKLIYLEAGSGATHAIEPEIISKVKEELNIPLIVGGGIRSKKGLESAYKAGADLVVIGTAFEQDKSFFNEIKK
ncbi:phosphoglycerol geranylgeranyltransferase [Winogradskyella immobilis]|uniref:Geranylgeranylglyceryl phosphate synthase n=1 Tax=Winogradskyella immobilis TaxID=2816852 RepID=A0ABS8ENZ9_9FLAO|nr:geranylgeranylglyceryl/heptaprenylglyceryl phosphate synthase [Winogradskyella immobilis]MCC1484295.1 geranylgeranylglyceryl/heptaprenylglyceryl phosphate synthase [Winogradskyella immobilis]MCG0016387.1 geranylgeranylglyceryl/heptaprenylglyceryl phosphate synthase [Winogradskyella immobilis]